MHNVGILEAAVRELDDGRRAALCAIVATRGSTPQPAGTIVCVDEAARMTGTLGGGCVEADVRRQACQALSSGRSKFATFQLDDDFGYDDGMICGGEMDVAIAVLSESQQVGGIQETLAALRQGDPASLALKVETDTGTVAYRILMEPAPKLLIAGGGHIAKVLAHFVLTMGFDVTVVDDRSKYAGADRFPAPIKTVVGDIGATLAGWPIDANTYVVIVTRGHRNDEKALAAVLASPAAYIGMIGSRRKISVIFDDLRQVGTDERLLKRVRAPIGLNIGAVTSEEIAISIAAELVAKRRENQGKIVEGPFPVEST